METSEPVQKLSTISDWPDSGMILEELTSKMEEIYRPRLPDTGMMGFVSAKGDIQAGECVKPDAPMEMRLQAAHIQIPETVELLPLLAGQKPEIPYSAEDMRGAQTALRELLQKNGWIIRIDSYSAFLDKRDGHHPQTETLILVEDPKGDLYELPPQPKPYPIDIADRVAKGKEPLPAAAKSFDETQRLVQEQIERMRYQDTGIPGVRIVDGNEYEANLIRYIGFLPTVRGADNTIEGSVHSNIDVKAPSVGAYILLPNTEAITGALATLRSFQPEDRSRWAEINRQEADRVFEQVLLDAGVTKIEGFSGAHVQYRALDGTHLEPCNFYGNIFAMNVEGDSALYELPPGIYTLEQLKAIHEGRLSLPENIQSIAETQRQYDVQFFPEKKVEEHLGKRWVELYANPEFYITVTATNPDGVSGEYVVCTRIWPGEEGPAGIAQYLKERFDAVIDYEKKTILYEGTDDRVPGMIIGDKGWHIQFLSEFCGLGRYGFQLEAPNVEQLSNVHKRKT